MNDTLARAQVLAHLLAGPRTLAALRRLTDRDDVGTTVVELLRSGRVLVDASGAVRLTPRHHELAMARLRRDVAAADV